MPGVWLLQLKNIWQEREARPRCLTAAYIGLMLALFPLVVGPHGYLDMTGAKHAFFMIVSAAYLLGLLVTALPLRGRGICPRLGVTQWLALGYGALCLLSAICSPYQHTVWLGAGRFEGMLTLAMYIGVFLAISLFGAARRGFLYALLLPVLVNVGLALLQFTGADPLGLYPAGYNYYDGNIAYSGEFLGTIGNAGLLAAFFCLAIPAFVLYFIRCRKQDKWAWLLLVAAALSLYVLLRSGILAGLVGLAAAAAVLPFLLLKSRRARLIWLLILVLLLVAGLLWLGNYDGPPEGALYEASALLRGEAEDSFGSGRILIWRETLALIKEKPLLGGGPDTLKDRLDLVFTAPRDDDSPLLRRTQVDNAHNDYLNIAANTGLLSLAVYIAALLLTAGLWVKRRGNTAALTIGGGLLAYAVQISFSFSLCIVAPLFWLGWGLLIAASRDK